MKNTARKSARAKGAGIKEICVAPITDGQIIMIFKGRQGRVIGGHLTVSFYVQGYRLSMAILLILILILKVNQYFPIFHSVLLEVT